MKKRHKTAKPQNMIPASLLVALFLLSWASGGLVFSGSQSASPSDISSASSQGSSLPSVLSLSAQGGSLPSILSTSLDPLKVRPGDSMTISAQISDPSGVFSVSAYAGKIEAAFFISMLHYTGWWTHG